MRIIRFIDERGTTHLGTPGLDATAQLLTSNDLFGHEPVESNKTARIAKVLAPLLPPNIFCIGLNYRRHALETRAPIPEHPVLFMKPTTSIAAPAEPIRIPRCCEHGPEVDYECELAVVIGKAGRDILPADALKHVLGYSVAIDVSARRWQKHNGGQWIRAKGFDGFCPLGPSIVTPDEIADPQNLTLRTILNGQVVQQASTSDMIFSVAQIIAFVSRDTTLLPGTLILTGTPAGVGVAHKPPTFLKAGDQLTVEIEKIGKYTCLVQDPSFS